MIQGLASRLKENMEKLTEERDQRIAAENREKEQNKRLQRQLRDTKEEMGELARKEAEASRKKHELVLPPLHLCGVSGSPLSSYWTSISSQAGGEQGVGSSLLENWRREEHDQRSVQG